MTKTLKALTLSFALCTVVIVSIDAHSSSQVTNTPIADVELIKEYKKSRVLKIENPYKQLPERVLRRKAVRFKISRTS